MGHELAARIHLFALERMDQLERSRHTGQGTVEYVGVVVMVTLLIGAVAVAGKSWSGDVGTALKSALVDAVKSASSGLPD